MKHVGPHFNKLTRKIFAKRGYALIAASIVVILLVGGIYLTWQGRENKEKQKTAKASLTTAQNMYNSGQSAITSGDNKKAATDLKKAQELAESLKNNKYVETEASSLLSKINSSLDQAEGVIRPNPTSLADVQKIVGKSPLGPFLINESLYLISKENGNIASVSVKTGEVATAIEKPSIDGNILAATSVARRSVLVFFTDTGNIYEFDTKELQVNKQDTVGDIEKPASMTSYVTNIYTLDSTNGKVYKRLKTSTGYGKRTEYITDGTSVVGGVGITTDSSIFVLGQDSSITKFLAGKKQDFSVSNLPFTMTKPNTIFTSEELTKLYLTDSEGNRVIIFDNAGKFINQQVSEKFKNINGIFVTGNLGYIAADGIVYKISL